MSNNLFKLLKFEENSHVQYSIFITQWILHKATLLQQTDFDRREKGRHRVHQLPGIFPKNLQLAEYNNYYFHCAGETTTRVIIMSNENQS